MWLLIISFIFICNSFAFSGEKKVLSEYLVFRGSFTQLEFDSLANFGEKGNDVPLFNTRLRLSPANTFYALLLISTKTDGENTPYKNFKNSGKLMLTRQFWPGGFTRFNDLPVDYYEPFKTTISTP